ncbi:MAG: vitamin K epoxide reductase family protein [Candidatus Marsarchaeota archaeon]|nr:vitamin K epoxide reductase family protein [Candidatus Marsarchaeota archaeon]
MAESKSIYTFYAKQYLIKMKANAYRKILFALVLLGIADSAYLTYVHYAPQALVCSSTGIVNCALVITSQYSVVFGIPLAIYGLAWFIAQLALLFVRKNRDIKLAWSGLGLIAVAYSAVSMHLLGKICEYCIALDALIVLIFILYFLAAKEQ